MRIPGLTIVFPHSTVTSNLKGLGRPRGRPTAAWTTVPLIRVPAEASVGIASFIFFFFFLQLQVTSSVIFDSGVQGMVLRRLYGLRRGPRVLWPPPGTAHGYHGTRTACPALCVTASGPSRHGPCRLLALPRPRPVRPLRARFSSV